MYVKQFAISKIDVQVEIECTKVVLVINLIGSKPVHVQVCSNNL